ncbi:peptidoglycan DD-metalloendopeptidase family protein, partial [Pediococcus pentosaceus]|uniref:peptidoglycan DD-metalloendopeptidase family protein n=1 Tax=Pediococcus pentosaceus TaxID=1255 RepID=UPI002F26A923
TVGSKWNSFKNGFRKSWNNHWNSMTNNLHSAWNSSYKHTRDFFSSMGTKWAGWKKSWSRSWNNHWDTMRSNLHSYWNKDLSHTKVFGKSMGDWLSAFKDSFKSGWSSLGTGVENIFKGLWKDLKGFAKDGMNDVIDIINGGINAVDSVIHKFGGKEKTIGDLSHVHFATGTGMFSGSRNPITKPTMAMLNDGNDSPQTGNKEMVVLPNGDSGIVQGRNTKMMLPAGTEVLNASETAMLMSMQGVTKYAKGTGFFGDILNSVTSGISGVTSWVGKKVGSLEKFFKTATNIIAHPIKSLENLFSWSSKGVSGVMSSIGHGLFNGVEKQAKTWWSTLWSMVDLDGGGGMGGPWAKAPGRGWTLTSGFGNRGAVSGGFSAHDGDDFSGGKTVHAMHPGVVWRVGGAPAGWGGANGIGQSIVTKAKDAFVIYQELNGKYNSGADILVKKGDTVKTGDAIAKLGSSGTHVHVGVSKSNPFSHSGSTTAGWLDILKMKASSSDEKDTSASSALQKLVKKQVGSGFWKMISKLASMFGSDGGSGDSPSGHMSMSEFTSIANQAARIGGVNLSANDIKRLYWQAHVESGVNPATGGGYDDHDGTGLPVGLFQYKKGTWNAWAKAGHKNIHSALDQVIAVIRDSNWRSDLAPYGVTRGWGPTGHKAFENGGIINTNQLIEVAEHNKPEMVLPLTNKSRANQLISQASQMVNGNNGSQDVATNSESNKKLDKVIALLAALVSGQGNVQAVIAKSDVVNAVKSDNKTASQYSQMMGY